MTQSFRTKVVLFQLDEIVLQGFSDNMSPLSLLNRGHYTLSRQSVSELFIHSDEFKSDTEF